jgi:hypothetical protein
MVTSVNQFLILLISMKKNQFLHLSCIPRFFLCFVSTCGRFSSGDFILHAADFYCQSSSSRYVCPDFRFAPERSPGLTCERRVTEAQDDG